MYTFHKCSMLFNEYEINKKYKISKHKKVMTKFGAKMMLELDGSFEVFLPTKVNAFLIENNTDEEKFSLTGQKVLRYE
ncbi:hypothetical protein TSAR_015451, partial [Trichomalopsis sarcophagae]